MEQFPHNNEAPEQKGLPFLDIEKRIKRLERYNEKNELRIEAHQEDLEKLEEEQEEDLDELLDMYTYNETIETNNMLDAHAFSKDTIEKLEKKVESGRELISKTKQYIVDCVIFREAIETSMQSMTHRGHTLKRDLVRVDLEELN